MDSTLSGYWLQRSKKAREAALKDGSPSRIRICHIDTGYDPDHITAPQNINHQLERNFVEGTNDARDPGKRGLLYNPGHGTGTIGILAGKTIQVNADGKPVFNDYLGGAPHCEIVPVRASNSVVHLFTSSMARGIGSDCWQEVLAQIQMRRAAT